MEWVAMRRVRSYVAVTKPRVVSLLLVTTLPSMLLAAGGWPGWPLVVATLSAGGLAAAAANATNCYIDSDIDELMDRTSDRPIVQNLVTRRSVLMLAIVLAITSNLVFLVWVNGQSALLADVAIAIYVGVYSLWLKRRTSLNIVIVESPAACLL